MSTGRLLGVIFSLLPCLAFADSPAPFIPDTPAGRALGSWLGAFNSGNRVRIESFDEAHLIWWTLDDWMALRASTGGYRLLSITKSARLWITFRAKERAGPSEFIGSLVVRSSNPAFISELVLDPPDRPRTIGDSERRRVIEGAAGLLDEFYVSPNVGHEMAVALRFAEKHGDYRSITDAWVFKTRLSDDLKAISHDLHLRVMYTPQWLTGTVEEGGEPAHPQGKNCAFDKVERYPNNVGYVKFDAFANSDACTEVAIAAMRFLAHVDAIIFDLRDNHGGGGEIGAVLVDSLFTGPPHLEYVWNRTTGKTTQGGPVSYVPAERLGSIPVYILTSHGTFSAGENFAYVLQAAKRATVVGEVTAGAANIGRLHRIDKRFAIWIPDARPISTFTGTNWEGKGVIPDVKVPASEALNVARKLAAQALARRSESKAW